MEKLQPLFGGQMVSWMQSAKETCAEEMVGNFLDNLRTVLGLSSQIIKSLRAWHVRAPKSRDSLRLRHRNENRHLAPGTLPPLHSGHNCIEKRIRTLHCLHKTLKRINFRGCGSSLTPKANQDERSTSQIVHVDRAPLSSPPSLGV